MRDGTGWKNNGRGEDGDWNVPKLRAYEKRESPDSEIIKPMNQTEYDRDTCMGERQKGLRPVEVSKVN